MKNIQECLKNLIKKRPISVFLAFLVFLLILIFIGNKTREPKVTEQQIQDEALKRVSVFKIDEVPRVSVQAKIDKENVIELFAQKSGIASYVYAKAGQRVYRGNTIVYISDTQFGANNSSVALEIAKKQNELSNENIERQLSIFKKQKKIIDKTPSPTDADDLQEEISKKQIRINKESAKTSNELTDLAVKQSQVAVQMARVSAPQNGIVEKIFVNPGQYVSAGTPIAIFKSDVGGVFAEVKVPFEIAKRVSVEEESYLQIGEDQIKAYPIYISNESTDSYLYSIIFCIEDKYISNVSNNSFISVSLALENDSLENTSSLLIPIDAIQLTQDKAFVFIVEGDRAKIKEVEIGSVIGQFVEVTSGLNGEEMVIENRNVFDGDSIFVE